MEGKLKTIARFILIGFYSKKVFDVGVYRGATFCTSLLLAVFH